MFFSEGDFRLISCGRVCEAKGYDWAVQAPKILLDKGYTDLHWWIVGGGPEEANLRKQIEEAGVGDYFHLLGMQNNPYPYIAAADLYVQPSRYENYSVVILEAMVLCKPILACGITGILGLCANMMIVLNKEERSYLVAMLKRRVLKKH